MAKESGTIYFIAGLMMGGLVGAGIGMLMAPEDKKRAEMIKTGGEILDNSMKSWKKFQDKKLNPAIKELSTKIKDEVENFDGKEFEKKVSDVVEKIQSKVQPKVKQTIKVKKAAVK